MPVPKKPPHLAHADLMTSFEKADAFTPRNKLGGGNYPVHAATGKAMTSAQLASVNKAAQISAANRSARASSKKLGLPGLKPGKF